MKALVDNTLLTLLLNPAANPRPNPANNKPTPHCRERIESLIDDLSEKKGTLYIPTPALAEALCVSDTIEGYFSAVQQHSCIELAAFDGRAAYELGRIIRTARSNGDKKSGQNSSWQHVKMDRMIVAIAVANSVDLFLSDDDDQIKFAKSVGITVKSSWDLSLSERHSQQHLSEADQIDWPMHRKPPSDSLLKVPPPA